MMVQYGFVDIYGVRWDDRQVNRYNDLQKRIQKFEIKGYKVPRELEMESHKCYQQPFYSERG